MSSPNPRRLLPMVVAYLPVPIAGAVLSAVWDVGASPEGGAGDMILRGTALTPPLFLPVILVAAAAAARREGPTGRIGAGFVSLVATAFLAGATLDLPNDFAAAESSGTPLALTAGLAGVHAALALSLLYDAVPKLIGREPTRMAPATA